MSSEEIAIRINGVGKRYEIFNRPGDRLKQFIYPRIFRALGLSVRNYFKEFWALNNLSFEIKRGETFGIIGRNGSGKSTLLQLICGTLSPTIGNVQVNGKVAALLELGSGFNPEFTGVENVYLNAAIFGLTKEEIDSRFDEIVKFAEIGQFIHQPVKTYSSGMMVRLAFAVIAHVDADILVVDEALSVGDAFFTQKCMRFIREFMSHGTLLFVSHDIGSVINLCEKVLWLDSGDQIMLSDAKSTAEKYLEWSLKGSYGNGVDLESVERKLSHDGRDQEINRLIQEDSMGGDDDTPSGLVITDNIDKAGGWKTGVGEILSVELLADNGEIPANWVGGEYVEMRISAIAHEDLDRPILGFLVRDRLGQDLFGENTLRISDLTPFSANSGEKFEAAFKFMLPDLPNGQYVVMASLANGDFLNHVQHHWMHDALLINVYSSKVRWGLVGIPFKDIKLRAIK